jgi:hypothetical protein
MRTQAKLRERESAVNLGKGLIQHFLREVVGNDDDARLGLAERVDQHTHVVPTLG